MRSRLAFVFALASLTAPAQSRREQLQSPLDAVREIEAGGSPDRAIARLKFLGAETMGARELIHDLDDLPPNARESVSSALGQLPSRESVVALEALTTDSSSVVRMNAAEGLARLHGRRGEPLLPLLRDPVMAVRRSAAHGLGATRDPRYGKALLAAAQRESELEVREALLVAIGQSGDRRQIAPLQPFLKSSSESTRLAAARALCLLESPTGLAVAKTLLASTERAERAQGIALLEGVPLKRALPLLGPTVNGADPRAAAMAARVLYQSGEKPMLEWLVLSAAHETGDGKLALEDELERLQVSDEQRHAILQKAAAR